MPRNRNKPVRTGPFSTTWNYIRLNRHAVFFSFIFFAFFPFLYSRATYDPELHLRFFALSVIMSVVTVYFVIRGKKESLFFVIDKSLLCFVLFFLLSLLSVAWAINPGDAFYEASKIFLLLVCFSCFVYSVRQSPDAIRVYTVAVVSASILFTLILVITTGPVLLDSMNGVKSASKNIRLVSSFANKNFYAETIFLCLPFVLYGSIFLKKTGKIICMTALFFVVLTILILTSVSVWIATMVFLILLTICIFRYRAKLQLNQALFRKATLISLICLAGLLVSFLAMSRVPAIQNFIYKPLFSKMDAAARYLRHDEKLFLDDPANANSLYERILLARNSIQMFREHPVTGCGPAGWKIYFPKFGITGTRYLNQGYMRFEHPHNDYLLVLCEEGIVGLVLWLGIFAMALMNIFRLINKTGDRKIIFLMVLLFCATAGFMTMSLFGYPKERLYSMLLLLLIIAIPSAMTGEKTNIPNRYGQLVPLVIALMCITAAYIQFKKLTGEVYMHSAITSQRSKDMTRMRNKVMKAKSYFYPLDATSTPLNWYLGLCSYYTGDTAAAFNYYQQALDENPYHVQALNDLGTLNEKKGDRKAAIELYQRSLMISPTNAKAILNLAVAYYNSGDLDQALITLKKYPSYDYRDYKNELQTILLAQANKFVQQAGDTTLAEYLSAQLNANVNYLLNMYASSPDKSIHFEAISDSLRKKSRF